LNEDEGNHLPLCSVFLKRRSLTEILMLTADQKSGPTNLKLGLTGFDRMRESV
jgi:hypothetical protein